ncbi:hypothetical protein L7F22_012031 [Adiantum nelumboides]|nr:hypothetical protein [Adiantum nelumboides]
MASCSSGSKRKRSIGEQLPALPAPPKRSSPAPPPPRDVLALPAPPTPIRAHAPFELDILLPDGTNVILLEKADDDLGVEELLLRVRRLATKQGCSLRWGEHVYLEDAGGNRVEDGHIFDSMESRRVLFLQDGRPKSVHRLQDMWNVTPDPELLVALPQEYTLETALADLLDNSLQAVWANLPGERRSISVILKKDKITIFDSGPGMDSTRENSIDKWGTMGSSKHRNLRASAIGGKPPFLQPYFGMYGFGGLIAAMHLGGVAVVSSKTKTSRKVVSLTLEKEKLMERCKTDRSWKTAGQYREPTEEEMRWSPHGSFTKVELSKLKKESVWTEKQVMCMLKDIYFPYIQCDAADSSQGGTMMPVEFQVNGMNLTEVDGGEVALTNMSSCNGSPFEIDIKMKRTSSHSDASLINDLDRATARIKCFYFPIKGGKESIDDLLEELHNARIGIKETFDNFCRVSIRRLGRLLPDARWRRLPFMEPKRKRGDKGSLPKICFERVKAFVDTDAGFIPTTSKMDLLSGHVFTSLLRNLGTRGNMPEDVILEIYRGTRHLKLQEVEKEYEEWIHEMHGVYDEEAELDNEQSIISMEGADELGFSQDVYRIYTRIIRKGATWKQGLRVKFYKGVPGYRAKDFYATLEYFVSEGLSEDKGNTKVICRPMEIAKAEGSSVLIEDEGVRLDLKKSKAVPIDFLTSDKCDILEEREWLRICDSKRLHEPGDIDILDKEIIEKLGLNGGIDLLVEAGVRPFENIYAVIRPNSYLKSMQDGKSMNPVDQKNIVRKSMQLKMQLKQLGVLHSHTSGKTIPEDVDIDNFMVASEENFKNIHGFYCFSMDKANFGKFYTKAGKYALKFFVIDEESRDIILEKTLEVNVLPSDKVCRWILKDVDGSEIPTARLGGEIGPLLVHCLDDYKNLKDVNWQSDSSFEVWSGDNKLEINLSIEGIAQQENKKTILIIKAIKLIGGLLDGIAEDYSATLKLIIGDKPEASMDIRGVFL